MPIGETTPSYQGFARLLEKMNRFQIPYSISILAALVVLLGGFSAFSNDRPLRALIFVTFGLGSILLVTVVAHRKE
jgi:Na+/pantothenate symporter